MSRHSLSLLALLLFFVPLKAQQDKGFEISKNLEIFANVYKNIHQYYVEDVDPGKTMKTAIDAMLQSLDPYTNYYPESDMEDVRLQLFGQYGGIGALIQQQDGSVYISELYEGQPADKAGLRPADRIMAVNGQSAAGKSTSEVSSILRGQAGTSAVIDIERQGKPMQFTIVRQEIKFKAVPYYGYVQGDFGYVKLSEFTEGSANEVRMAVSELMNGKKELKGLVLDLRGNGGGLMNEAVDIVNIFVPKGKLVVETKGKVASKNVRSLTRHTPLTTTLPLAVLIDNYSASASEIVSGSLQDFDRAVIVGQRSFGKGLVQNILPMAYNCQMKVTVSKYYIPSGRCIQALDYSQRDENGRAVKVPDSLKTAFKTSNGRTVYDGFGIEPDVPLEPTYMSSIAASLYAKFHVFNFVTQFTLLHDSIAPASQFQITDQLYDEFVAYLADKDYSYSTLTEKMLDDLRDVAKEENYLDAIAPQIDALEQKLKDDKKNELYRYRDEISEMLLAEILTRYYYEKGRIEGSLRYDTELQKACNVIADPAQLASILGVK